MLANKLNFQRLFTRRTYCRRVHLFLAKFTKGLQTNTTYVLIICVYKLCSKWGFDSYNAYRCISIYNSISCKCRDRLYCDSTMDAVFIKRKPDSIDTSESAATSIWDKRYWRPRCYITVNGRMTGNIHSFQLSCNGSFTGIICYHDCINKNIQHSSTNGRNYNTWMAR